MHAEKIVIVDNQVLFPETSKPLNLEEDQCALCVESFKSLLEGAHNAVLGYLIAQVFTEKELLPQMYDGMTFYRAALKKDPLTRRLITKVNYFACFPYSSLFIPIVDENH